MRHKLGLRKLGLSSSHRRAMFRNMVTSFFRHERYETTLPKAKELRRIVEKLITLGRRETLASRRRAYSYILDKSIVHKLFADVGPRYASRPGGYTRVVRTWHRHGDAAEMAIIELVRDGEEAQTEDGKDEAAKASTKAKGSERGATSRRKKSEGSKNKSRVKQEALEAEKESPTTKTKGSKGRKTTSTGKRRSKTTEE